MMRNILFIMCDQLRFDALGFMGKFPVQTPNIDRLAEKGTVFNNAYCSNPVCVPARASIMTGVNSYDHGVYYNEQNWPERLDTFAGNLADNAYYTTLVGKTHFLPPKKAAGFQKIFVEEDYKAFLEKKGLGKKPARNQKPKDVAGLNRAYPVEPTYLPDEYYMPNFLTDKALHELDLISQRRECDEDGNEPFLMKLSYLKPHSPCDPPEPYFSMYAPEDMPAPVKNEKEIQNFPRQVKDSYDIWTKLDEERALKHRAQYFGCVSLLDEQVGRVLQKLEDMGIYDNTLIVLTSDHGDMLCDHHLQQKGYFFEPSVRVPLIFSGPGVPEGKVVNENVSHIDIFPTLMEYCGLAMPKRRDKWGRLIYPDVSESDAMSLMPYFQGDEPVNPDRIVVSENAMHGQRIMLKKHDTKINYYVNDDMEDEIECFDLKNDPDECNHELGSFSVDDMELDMKQMLDDVLRKSAPHGARYYYFQGKIRPVFT